MRFVIVGVLNTAIDLLVLNFLVYILKVDNPFIFSIIKGISFSVAVINSYFMNKYFTFAKKETKNKDFYMFIIISLIGLFINIIISSTSFYLLGLYPNIISINLIATISGVIGAMFTMVFNYVSYSYFVFK
jgi:putative flippase GtrA